MDEINEPLRRIEETQSQLQKQVEEAQQECCARTFGADLPADIAYEHEMQSKAACESYITENWECWSRHGRTQ